MRCTYVSLGRSVPISPYILVSLFQDSSGLSIEVRIFSIILHADHKAYVLLNVWKSRLNHIWAFISLPVRLSFCFLSALLLADARSPCFSSFVSSLKLHFYLCLFKGVFTAESLHPQTNYVILVTEFLAIAGGLICHHAKLLSTM